MSQLYSHKNGEKKKKKKETRNMDKYVRGRIKCCH